MPTVKTVQWNIGGGKIRHAEADPVSVDSYVEEGLEKIIDSLEKQAADIITLQETHERDGHNQTQDIAEALGFPSWVNDTYAPSHIEDGFMLGQGIISRFPINERLFNLFRNPNFSAVWRGEPVSSHDKGVSSAYLSLGKGAMFLAQTLHSTPFRAFGVDVDSPEVREVFQDMERNILRNYGWPSVLQGDFNLDSSSLKNMFPELFVAGFEEIEQYQATTPRGRRYDHILFSGMKALKSTVLVDQPTDHFPVVATLSTT